MTDALYASNIRSLPRLHTGKVRDIYAVDDGRMLIVTTDRLSAFDVVMPTPIPGKGKVLTAMANFWFRKLAHILPHHLTGDAPEDLVSVEEREQVAGRAVVVKRLKALPLEAVYSELNKYSGTQFDPVCVEAFLRVLDSEGEDFIRKDQTFDIYEFLEG